MFFCIGMATVVLDGPIGVKFAWSEVTKLLFDSSALQFEDEQTRPSTFNLTV